MPVSPLRAFEAAARLGSFAAAAEELGVTPGAVTQHVKSLEAWANAPLFRRSARGIAPTELTLSLLPAFSAAFDELGAAVHRLRSEARPMRISIATLPSIAQLWLPRKLEALRREVPEISVSVTALETLPNLRREQVDVAIFFFDGPPERGDIQIAPDRVFPVCTPALARTLTTPGDLAQAALLHDATWAEDWFRWLAAVGVGAVAPTRGQTYSLFAVALEEARRGAGILISHEALVAHLLDTGDLVRPFPQVLEPDRRLAMRVSPALARRRFFATLRDCFTAP
jgi:LysR family glycine cleavage system transcriptional activator